ncbi:hypothetical protein K438DRAFT_1859803 [Mycena galopus ATCC 62051]|nr:hypothetical protein K438DRAFT_1877648 [Mycena galopus ATCC 62051]KAF8160486.1 hypothetical protein K438DRAFT_1859803 [Mycena galopus ATCC 62051]
MYLLACLLSTSLAVPLQQVFPSCYGSRRLSSTSSTRIPAAPSRLPVQRRDPCAARFELQGSVYSSIDQNCSANTRIY